MKLAMMGAMTCLDQIQIVLGLGKDFIVIQMLQVLQLTSLIQYVVMDLLQDLKLAILIFQLFL